MSYTEFSVTYIHNKFWGVNSVKVPSQRVVLDKNGHTTEDLFKTEEQKYNFEIYWEEHMVGGEVCIPGEGNYCCVKGKFFHLEKVKAAGFIDDQESFYYTLIYDDGQNDGLTNNVHLCGTINLTGDKDLVRKHIVQTTPLISNVNNFRYLNGYIVENDDVNIIFPAKEKINQGTRNETFSSYDFLTVNRELKKLKLGEPTRDKLVIPFLYRTKPKYHWKGLLVKSLNRLKNKSLGIYDVSQDNQMRRILEVKFNTNELYVISTKENKVFNYAKSLNDNKYIEEIDLSGLTDLVELAPTTLSPLYDTVESVPKFNLKGLCETIRSRFNGPLSLLPKMEEILIEVFFDGLGDVISSEINLNEKRVFKNVTVTPIARDIAGFDYENKLTTVNPEGLTKFDSLIPHQKGFRNFIFSNDSTKEDDMIMVVGTTDIPEYIRSQGTDYEKLPHKNFFSEWLKRTKWFSKYADRSKDNTASIMREMMPIITPEYVYPTPITAFNYGRLCTSKGVQLVLPIHTHKFVEDGQEESDELDFTRTDGSHDNVLMLLPDYERNTHVGSIKCPSNLQNLKSKFNLTFDPRDSTNPLKGEPIIPFITTELFEIDEYSVNDALKRKNLLLEGKNNLSRDISEIHPMITLQNFLEGCYAIKYKTYRSHCGNHRYCDYYEYTSTKDANPYQRRSAFNIGPLARAHRLGDGVQYQLEMTLPYSDDLITFLESQGYHHDFLFMGKVVNGEKFKGKHHPNPLIGKDGKVQRMDAQDLKKLGSKDIVAIGMNPTNNSYLIKPWLDEKLITDDDADWMFNDYGSSQGLHNGSGINYEWQVGSPIITTAYNILQRFLVNKTAYGPNIKDTDIPAIPLRIYSDTSSNYHLRDKDGYPQLSTGFVIPYEGFNYLCYYRFHPRFDAFGFGFSDAYTAFEYKSNDYFVMVIPNTWKDSSWSIPQYTYRETIDKLTRESNVAFLVNGSVKQNPQGIQDELRTNGRIYGGWVFANNRGADGGAQAEYIHNKMKDGANIPDLFFDEFIRKEFKTNHTDNPSQLKVEYQYYQNGGQGFTINTLDEELPSFMVKYLNPNSSLCNALYSWKKSTSTTDSARLNEGKSKLSAAVNALKVNLSTQNTGFALEGTDGYISVKLNIQEKSTGDFELFTTRPSLIKSKTTNAWKFEYYDEPDVDVLINTSNEINIYGKRLPQKSRYISETKELDLKLRITPLEDSKQTQASSGYKVEMKTDAQDLIRDTIEIPKEQVKALQMSDFERETMFRTIDLKAAERHSEAMLLDLNRDKFKVRDSYEQSENARNAFHRMSTATVDIAAGAAKSFTLNPFSYNKSIEGTTQMAKGIINLADAAGEVGNAETNRKARYAIGIEEFTVKGDLMRRQHESNRANEMEKLGQMSSKIQYPQMNSGLIYKQFNKTEFLSDVYITQYFPSGELLRYIKEYYKEYGYEILVRDFVCIGIDSIRTHLRYLNIFKNEYTNQRIRALIEARAMNGIFVSDTELFG